MIPLWILSPMAWLVFALRELAEAWIRMRANER